MEEIIYAVMAGGGITAIGAGIKLTVDTWREYRDNIDSERNL